MKGLTKLKKLLCFLIVSIFVFGFGGEIAKADSFTSKAKLDYLGDYFQWKYNTTKGLDAYCLDSASLSPALVGGSRELTPVANITDILHADKVDSVIKILKASESLDLEAGKRYYVTQAAIWYTVDGIYSTGHQNGIADSFYKKITTTSPYNEAWQTLINASKSDDPVNPNTTLSIDAQDSKLSEDGNYLVSKDITLSVESNVSVIQQAPTPSEGACILYNGQCTTTATIPANTSFKVRVNKPNEGSGQVQMAIEAISTNSYTTYSIDGYFGTITTAGKIQDMITLRKQSKTISHARKFVGNYENEDTKDIEIQKTDADTGLKVAGAKLKITDENGTTIGVYQSTAEGVANPTVKLPIGKYYLSEETQPNGYYYSNERIEFNVVRNGSNVDVTDANGNTITPTISFSNKAIKIKFRKVVDKVRYDNEGKMHIEKVPMAGVKFKILSYTDLNHDNDMLCAITDANGYLTQSCPGNEDTHNVNSNGEYRLGIDFGKASDIYQIKEYCLTDECKPFVTDSTTGETYSISHNAGVMFQVFNGGRSIVLASEILSTDYSQGSTPVITINIKNQYHIDISKTDITGGSEIPGAIITVTDPNLQFGEGDLKADNVIDRWESTTEPHTIIGIVPGVKYRLTEETAPDGFIQMKNSIDFVMDEDGNITTSDADTGEVVTDMTGSDYHLLVTNKHKTVFSKRDAVTGEEIAGAHLKVCTKDSYNAAKASTGDGNNCQAFENPNSDKADKRVEWISVAGEDHTEAALPAGPYYLIETIAPVGYYKKTTAVPFEVVIGDTTKIKMENKLTKLVITKKNDLTGDRVAGAKFEILNSDDRTIAKDYLGNELVWTSDGVNDWEIMGIPTGNYILVETQSPEDFQEGMIIGGEIYNEYEFSISENEEDVNIDATVISITNVPRTGLSTLNLFAIGGLMIFAGYETIKIYRRKALN